MTNELKQAEEALNGKLAGFKAGSPKKSQMDLEMNKEQATQARLQKDITLAEK